jgi:hypothetical protein
VNDAATLGFVATYRRFFRLFSPTDSFEAGISARYDRIAKSQKKLAIDTSEVTLDELGAKVQATDAAGYIDLRCTPGRAWWRVVASESMASPMSSKRMVGRAMASDAPLKAHTWARRRPWTFASLVSCTCSAVTATAFAHRRLAACGKAKTHRSRPSKATSSAFVIRAPCCARPCRSSGQRCRTTSRSIRQPRATSAHPQRAGPAPAWKWPRTPRLGSTRRRASPIRGPNSPTAMLATMLVTYCPTRLSW